MLNIKHILGKIPIKRFDHNIELEYQLDLGSEKINMLQLTSSIGTLLFMFFGFLDIWMIPSVFFISWWIRLFVICFTLLILFTIKKYREFVIRHYSSIICISYLIFGTSINLIILTTKPTDPAWGTYYAGLMLVTMGLYTLTYLSSYLSILLGVFLLLSYICVATTFQGLASPKDWPILLSSVSFLMAINVIGFFSHQAREGFSRQGYLLKQRLKNDSAIKSQFLSNMSHELRTPLNATINFVDMVADGYIGPISQEQKVLLSKASKSSNHLLQLINDILDIAKIQAEKLSLFIEEDVNIRNEIEVVTSMMQGIIQEKTNVQFLQEIEPNLPIISGDKRRIRQILLNLLTNAFKFTEKGSVTLKARRMGNFVMVSILDTGIGIEKSAQNAIFEPFIQTTDGIKQVEGTGLGLPVSRSLVEAHQGMLWLESEPSKGSNFSFTLPIDLHESR